MSHEPLYLQRLSIETPRLVRLGQRRGLPMREADFGYLSHCLIREVLGEGAPQPFAITKAQGRWLELLGYSSTPLESLRQHAEAFADPEVFSALSWENTSQKPMPAEWPKGWRLNFQLRACPVVRMSSESPNHRKGAEVDAFLARCWSVGKEVKVDREAVYREWLGDQFERRGGAHLLSARLRAFQRQRVLRRDHGAKRKSVLPERPDALIEGTLEIMEGTAFTSLLRQGVGRHRAFGFGMLLLKPARQQGC